MLYLVLSSSHYVHAFASHETLLCLAHKYGPIRLCLTIIFVAFIGSAQAQVICMYS